MKKIEELTAQQWQEVDDFAAKYEALALSGDDSFDVNVIRREIDWLYSLIDLPSPNTVVCSSPLDLVRASKLKKGSFFDCLGFGFDAGWTAFYDCMQYLGVEYDSAWEFDRWKDFVCNSGIFASVLYEYVAFVSIRPCLIRRRDDGNLHCENGPAIAWRDGYEEFFVNGVAVDPEFVMTSADNLDSTTWVLKESNAERRREAVRKIGIERVVVQCGAVVLDRQGDMYELLSLNLGEQRRRPYLKMRNPSIGVYHIEGVHPDCTTVQEALNWRASGDRHKPWNPEELT